MMIIILFKMFFFSVCRASCWLASISINLNSTLHAYCMYVTMNMCEEQNAKHG